MPRSAQRGGCPGLFGCQGSGFGQACADTRDSVRLPGREVVDGYAGVRNRLPGWMSSPVSRCTMSTRPSGARSTTSSFSWVCG